LILRPFDFEAGSFTNGELVVGWFRGSEGLSRLYQFDVELVALEDAVDVKQCLGKDALLTIRSVDLDHRHVHGMVGRVEVLGARGGRYRYRARVVPRLWRLRHASQSRIFQDQTTVEIVKNIFDGWKIGFFALSGEEDLVVGSPQKTGTFTALRQRKGQARCARRLRRPLTLPSVRCRMAPMRGWVIRPPAGRAGGNHRHGLSLGSRSMSWRWDRGRPSVIT